MAKVTNLSDVLVGVWDVEAKLVYRFAKRSKNRHYSQLVCQLTLGADGKFQAEAIQDFGEVLWSNYVGSTERGSWWITHDSNGQPHLAMRLWWSSIGAPKLSGFELLGLVSWLEDPFDYTILLRKPDRIKITGPRNFIMPVSTMAPGDLMHLEFADPFQATLKRRSAPRVYGGPKLPFPKLFHR